MQDSYPIYRVFPIVLGKGQVSPYMVGTRSKIFGKIDGMQVDIIQGDDSAGHCLVIRDLIPMNLFT